MSTCDRIFRIHWKIWVGVTIFVGIFSAVYEHYGRGIRSKPMIFAFMIPLLFGAAPAFFLARKPSAERITYESGIRMGINLFCSGVATLTMGSIATGVVEIFGTTNRLLKYYIIVGGILLIIGAITGSIAYSYAVSDFEAEDEEERIRELTNPDTMDEDYW